VSAAARVAVDLAVRVYDRGPEPEWHKDRRSFGPWWPYEAELVDYPAVREPGMTPWEAVHRLVSVHRVLLERRWSA
jgi:hypothetical protein